MTRPADRHDYDGDCPQCWAGERHSLEDHDAALVDCIRDEEEWAKAAMEDEIRCVIRLTKPDGTVVYGW